AWSTSNAPANRRPPPDPTPDGPVGARLQPRPPPRTGARNPAPLRTRRTAAPGAAHRDTLHHCTARTRPACHARAHGTRGLPPQAPLRADPRTRRPRAGDRARTAADLRGPAAPRQPP